MFFFEFSKISKILNPICKKGVQDRNPRFFHRILNPQLLFGPLSNFPKKSQKFPTLEYNFFPANIGIGKHAYICVLWVAVYWFEGSAPLPVHPVGINFEF